MFTTQIRYYEASASWRANPELRTQNSELRTLNSELRTLNPEPAYQQAGLKPKGLTGFDSKDSGFVSMPGIGDVAR